MSNRMKHFFFVSTALYKNNKQSFIIIINNKSQRNKLNEWTKHNKAWTNFLEVPYLNFTKYTDSSFGFYSEVDIHDYS